MLGQAGNFTAGAGNATFVGPANWAIAAPVVGMGVTAATAAVTLTAWLLPDPRQRGKYQTPFAIFGGTYGSAASCAMGIQVDLWPPFADQNLTVVLNTANPVGYIPVATKIPGSPGDWVFLGITLDPVRSVISVFTGARSGGAVSVSLAGQGSFYTSFTITAPQVIVGGSCDSTRGYAGLIDEVRVYPRVLTAQEVAAAATFGAAAAPVPPPPPSAPPAGNGFCSSASHYWPLSRASANGATFPDEGGWNGVGLSPVWPAAPSGGAAAFSQPAALGFRDAIELDGATRFVTVSTGTSTFGGALSFSFFARADSPTANQRREEWIRSTIVLP